jgi:hypothetical protein
MAQSRSTPTIAGFSYAAGFVTPKEEAAPIQAVALLQHRIISARRRIG